MERKVSNLTQVKVQGDHRIERMSEIHRFSPIELEQYKVLYPGTSNEDILKVFRDLRTQVYAKAHGRNFVCMVTSVVPQSGCSYVVNNLAAAITLDKTRTALVVDCNFYSPAAGSLIVADGELGLTDYLENPEMGVEGVVYASGIPRVRVVPVGRNTESATEKLSSQRMQAFLLELKSRYADRYVLIDAPPVGEYPADIRILASLCDFVVLVVPSGKVKQEEVRSAVDMIGEDRLAAVVFNHPTDR